MNAHNDNTSSIGDVITGAAGALFALATLTMTLFPFAIPGIILTVAVIVPLVLLAVVVGLLAAVAGAPVMVVRALLRRAAARDRAGIGVATPQPS